MRLNLELNIYLKTINFNPLFTTPDKKKQLQKIYELFICNQKAFKRRLFLGIIKTRMTFGVEILISKHSKNILNNKNV